MSVDNWYFLYDLYIVKMGLEHKVKSKNELLKEYGLMLLDHIDNPKQPKVMLKLKESEIKSNSDLEVNHNDIDGAMQEKWGTINKEEMDVHNYTNLLLSLLKKNGSN